MCGQDNHSIARRVTKVHRIRLPGNPDVLAAYAGSASAGVAMVKWYSAGADPKQFPKAQHADKEEWCDFWVVRRSGVILKYERHPDPIVYDDTTFVDGCGAEFAAGAMAMGADAVRAVEVANELCSDCGLGYDALTFE